MIEWAYEEDQKILGKWKKPWHCRADHAITVQGLPFNTSEPDLYYQFFCILDTAYLVISVYYQWIQPFELLFTTHMHYNGVCIAMHNYASCANSMHYCIDTT